MKTIRIFAVVLFILYGRSEANAGECLLDFEVHRMYASVFQTRAENFGLYFRRNDGAVFSDAARTRSTTVGNVLGLQESCGGGADPHPDERHLHLLRIHYGIRGSDGEVEMIFQPVYGVTPTPVTDPAIYHITVEGDYYIIGAGGVFIKLVDDPMMEQASSMIARYQHVVNGVLINPDGDNTTPPDARVFQSSTDNDINGDARYITMPFQEIDAFFPSDDATIYFTHVAEWDEPQEVYRPNKLKHAIVMSDALPADAVSGTMIADLGSLCPVNCEFVTVSGGIMAPFHRLLYLAGLFIAKHAVAFTLGVLAIIGGLAYQNYKLKKQLKGKS